MKKITLLLMSILLLLSACGQAPVAQEERQVNTQVQPVLEEQPAREQQSSPQQPVQDTPPLAAEQAEAADTPVIEETSVPQTAPTTQPTVTEDIPSETVHAKTGYVESEPTPEPEPTLKPAAPADRQAAIDAANAYAVTQYGVETDTGLTLDNSAYRFPAAVPADASQATLDAKARDMVDFTFRQLMMQAGVDSIADAGFRCSVTIVEDGESLLIYVLYDG